LTKRFVIRHRKSQVWESWMPLIQLGDWMPMLPTLTLFIFLTPPLSPTQDVASRKYMWGWFQ